VSLDVDPARVEADQSVGNCPCEHVATVDNKSSRVRREIVTNVELR
jgi:hypothetical protein